MKAVAGNILAPLRRRGRSPRRIHSRPTCLGLVGVLLLAGGAIQAQELRLTVRPREMAQGTQNPAAGEYPLDSVPTARVSIPPQCVGARRCPLFVFLPGAAQTSEILMAWLRPVADKYGLVLLALSEDHYDTGDVDAALKETLRRFAIEPDKIAIVGRCASGATGMTYGTSNVDVFSRVAVVSGGVPTDGLDPQNKTVEFFLVAGYGESGGNFRAAQELRRAGHPVKVGIRLRGHEHQIEDYDFLGRWFQESWAMPNPAARPAPSVVAEPLPLLTTQVISQMTAFWTSFLKEPDSIRKVARRAHLREVVVPVGEERPTVVMTDMPALAARYPSVAAALKQAGLTAEQHEAYRVALISAMTIADMEDAVGTVDSNSVMGKNLEFFNTHPDELGELATAGIENLGKLGMAYMSAQFMPDQGEKLGAVGIWRTP